MAAETEQKPRTRRVRVPIAWEVGDVAVPTPHSISLHPCKYVIVRLVPSSSVLYGRRIMRDGRLALEITTIHWPMKKGPGRWTGDPAELQRGLDQHVPVGLAPIDPKLAAERPQFAVECGFSVGEVVRSLVKTRAHNVYRITRIGQSCGMPVLYGKRLKANGQESCAPEVMIRDRVEVVPTNQENVNA